jgi:hypothetical protein
MTIGGAGLTGYRCSTRKDGAHVAAEGIERVAA